MASSTGALQSVGDCDWGRSMIGKWILIFGVVLILVGTVVWLIESLGLPLGRLPGDVRTFGCEGRAGPFPSPS